MSRESLLSFIERMRTDEIFVRMILEYEDAEERMDAARAAGYSFSIEDMVELDKELDEESDEELPAV
jgi:predicted ribosomally synthesized peptide with nif11-like leader